MISDDTGRDSGHAGRPHKVFLFLSLTTQDTRLDTRTQENQRWPKVARILGRVPCCA